LITISIPLSSFPIRAVSTSRICIAGLTLWPGLHSTPWMGLLLKDISTGHQLCDPLVSMRRTLFLFIVVVVVPLLL
jgi:hypothetical protein